MNKGGWDCGSHRSMYGIPRMCCGTLRNTSRESLVKPCSLVHTPHCAK